MEISNLRKLHNRTKVEDIQIEQFSDICRTCLVQGAHNHIFDITYNENALPEILRMCTTLQVQKEDDLPQNICSSCLSQIFQSFTFLTKCSDSNTILQCILQQNFELQQQKENGSDLLKENDETLDNSELFNIIYDPPKSNLRRKVKTSKKTRFKSRISRPPFKCNNCEEIFNDKKLLKEHYKVSGHSDICRIACTVCSKMFTSSKLRDHMRTHTKEKPYECKFCIRKFSIAGNLRRHLMIHTGERPHMCELCGKSFIQSTTLHNHKKTHLTNLLMNETGRTRIQCEHCGQAFKRTSSYQKHLEGHEEGAVKNIPVIEDKVYKAYKCSVCHRAFKLERYLRAHERVHGEKLFLCNECGKGFITNSALQSHLRVHTGEKPHICSVCNKAFSHIGSLESHALIHAGKKPFKCTVCSRAFTQLTHLKYHSRTHSGEKPYNCSYCKKSFAIKGNLTVHVRTHTGETPYICSVCDKGFYDSSSLKKHLKGHVLSEENQLSPTQPPSQVSIQNNLHFRHIDYLPGFT